MGKIAIVTDSNSGITQKEGKELGISVIPMPFYINEELYFEDITLTQDEFYQKLNEDEDIKTSQPAPGDVLDLWEKLLEDHDEIVICLLVIVPHSRTICKICCIKSFFGLLGKSCINCTMARHKSMTNQNILHIGTCPPFGTGSKRVPACRTCDALFPAHSSKFRVISPSAASRITALAALLLAL